MDNLKSLIKYARRRQRLADAATIECLNELCPVCKDKESYITAEEATFLYIFEGTDSQDRAITLNDLIRYIEDVLA